MQRVTDSTHELTIFAVGGDDSLTGGAGDDEFTFEGADGTVFQFNGDDTVGGGGGFIESPWPPVAAVDADFAAFGVEALQIVEFGEVNCWVSNAAASLLFQIWSSSSDLTFDAGQFASAPGSSLLSGVTLSVFSTGDVDATSATPTTWSSS